DYLHRDDRVEILGRPVAFDGRGDAAHDVPRTLVAAHPAPRLLQRLDQRLEEAVGDPRVYEQRLGRAANAGPAHLGVDHHRLRHLEVGLAVDIDVVDALEMGKDRNPRLHLDAGDEALAAARDDDVDGPVEAGEHQADGG